MLQQQSSFNYQFKCPKGVSRDQLHEFLSLTLLEFRRDSSPFGVDGTIHIYTFFGDNEKDTKILISQALEKAKELSKGKDICADISKISVTLANMPEYSSKKYDSLLEKIKKGGEPSVNLVEHVLDEISSKLEKNPEYVRKSLTEFITQYRKLLDKDDEMTFYFAMFGIYILGHSVSEGESLEKDALSLLLQICNTPKHYRKLLGVMFDGSHGGKFRPVYEDYLRPVKFSAALATERYLKFVLKFPTLQSEADKEVLWKDYVLNSLREKSFPEIVKVWADFGQYFRTDPETDQTVTLETKTITFVVEKYQITPKTFQEAYRISKRCYPACLVKISQLRHFELEIATWINAIKQIGEDSYQCLQLMFVDALENHDHWKISLLWKYANESDSIGKEKSLKPTFFDLIKKNLPNSLMKWKPSMIQEFQSILETDTLMTYLLLYKELTSESFVTLVKDLLNRKIHSSAVLHVILTSSFLDTVPDFIFSIPFEIPHELYKVQQDLQQVSDFVKMKWSKLKMREVDILKKCPEDGSENTFYNALCQTYSLQKFSAKRNSSFEKIRDVCQDLEIVLQAKYSYFQSLQFITALKFLRSDIVNTLHRPMFSRVDDPIFSSLFVFMKYAEKIAKKPVFLQIEEAISGNFINPYKELVDRVTSDQEKMKDLISTLDKKDKPFAVNYSLKTLIAYIDSTIDIEKLIICKLDEFENLKTEMDRILFAIRWLHERNLINQFDNPSPMIEMTLVEAKQQLTLCKSYLSEISPTNIEAIIHFGAKSIIFNETVQYHLKKSGQISITAVNTVIQQVLELLENVFCQKSLKFKELTVLAHGTIKSLKKTGTKISDEASSVASYFKSKNDDSNEFDVGILESALKIMEYSRLIPSLVNCFAHYKMSNKISVDITNLVSELASNHISLGDVKSTLVKCTSTLENLQNFHLRLFDEIISATDIVDFFIKFMDFSEFEKKVDVVTSGLRKNTYEMTLVSNLKVTYDLLAPFFDRDFTKFTFSDICKHYIKIIQNEDISRTLLDALHNVNSKLPEVILWFSGVGGISSVKLLKSGKFVSNLTRHYLGDSLELEYNMDQSIRVLKQDDLNDLITNIIIYTKEIDEKDPKALEIAQNLLDFKDCVEIALECHNVILELESNGYHPIALSKISITDSEISKTNCQDRLLHWKQVLSTWLNRIQELDSILELFQLSSVQLVSFTNLLNDQSLKRSQKLISYCLTLFPDCDPNLIDPILIDGALKVMEEHDGKETEKIKAFIKVLSETCSPKDPRKLVPGPRYVMKCYSDRKDNFDHKSRLYPLLKTFEAQFFTLSENSSIMNVGQVLFASQLTSKSDLQRFYERRRVFPDKAYMIWGAESLLPSVREEMIRTESQLDDDQVPSTVYVLYGPNGQDSFSLMKESNVFVDYSQNMINTIHQCIKSFSSTVSIVYGGPGSGKTRLIMEKMDSSKPRIIISPNEDFTTHTFLEKFNPFFEKESEISIHFNISSRTNFVQVDRFFFCFFLFRILIDSSSGELLMVPRCKIHWYIEVPFESSSDFFDVVPILKLFVLSVETPDTKFVLDDESRFVAKIIANKDQLMPDLKKKFIEQDPKAVLSNCFETHNLTTLFEQKAFISILDQKCAFYTNLAQQYSYNNKISIDNPNSTSDDLGLTGKDYRERANTLKKSLENFEKSFSNLLKEVTALVQGSTINSFHVCKNAIDSTDLMTFETISRFDLETELTFVQTQDDISVELTLKQRLEAHLRSMRSYLSKILGIGNEPNILINILSRNQYILTYDFFYKMILLHERFRMGANLIFVGETGIGKTEMLRIFSEIYNCNQDIRPETDVIISDAFKKFFEIDTGKSPSNQNFQKVVQFFEKYVDEFKSHYTNELVQRKDMISKDKTSVESEISPKNSVRVAKRDINMSDPKIEKIQGALNDNTLLMILILEDATSNLIKSKYFALDDKFNLIYWIKLILEHLEQTDDLVLYQTFVTHFTSIMKTQVFDKYPLVQPSNESKSFYQSVQSNPNAFRTNEFMEFLKNVLKIAPSNLFFKIMMHGDLTIGEIRKLVNNVIEKNQEANLLVDLKNVQDNLVLEIKQKSLLLKELKDPPKKIQNGVELEKQTEESLMIEIAEANLLLVQNRKFMEGILGTQVSSINSTPEDVLESLITQNTLQLLETRKTIKKTSNELELDSLNTQELALIGNISKDSMRLVLKRSPNASSEDVFTYKSSWNKIRTIVFIDELNTSSYAGLMKEIFYDRKIDGVIIPDTVFFVGAINPCNDPVDKKNAYRKYTVKEMPPSMKNLQVKFGEIDLPQQEVFLEVAFLEHNIPETKNVPPECINDFKQTLLWCQKYIEALKAENLVPSFRDIHRFIKLYSYFYKINLFDSKSKILYMTVVMCYYFRLGGTDRVNFVKDFHAKFAYDLSELIKDELDKFYKKLKESDKAYEHIPKGIARTQGLVESLFCNIICIQCGIPLFIVGPPGTSKTLSFNIASTTTKKTFPFIEKVHNAHYQSSQYSTGQEIETVFKSQITQMEAMAKTRRSDIFCVFLDEAGLPTEKRHALKVIHFYLDHATLSCVIISNTMLDAAKTNRALLLKQHHSDDDDLRSLAEGCLFTRGKDEDEKNIAIMNGMIKAYKTVNSLLTSDPHDQYPQHLFQLRDFIYFLRMIDRDRKDHMVTPDNVYYSLQRNFNGVFPRMFEKISAHFFKCIKDEMKGRFKFEFPSSPMTYKDVLISSIKDRIKKEEDPNHAPFRYVLLIDPTETQSSFDLLFTEKILDRQNDVICSVSDFAQDENSYAKSQIISDFNKAMHDGKTVVLVNGLAISSSLYDVFNRHFSIIQEENGSKCYANVAMGAFSRKCQVHKDFQLIVHMPLSEYINSPVTLLPFLNRFEKYIFGFSDLWNDMINSSLYQKKKAELEDILEGVLHFVETFKSQTFYGYLKETVHSLMIQFMSTKPGILDIPEPLRILNNSYKPATQDLLIYHDSKDRIRETIRRINFHLLQIAKPESVYLQRKVLPKAYIEAYLGNQEHLTFGNFCSGFFAKGNQEHKKFIVYTRSSPNIEFLSNQMYQDQFSIEIGTQSIVYINLASIDTQLMTVELISDFFKSGKENLIVLCNMSTVTTNQINFFKQQFDSRGISSSVKVLLVAYFPTHFIALGKSIYNTIYLNDWQYIYIDGHPKISTKDIDSRWWFTTAVGLEKISSEHLTLHLIQPFENLLQDIFQKESLDKIKVLWKSRPYLMDIFANYFTDIWLKKYIREVIGQITESVSLANTSKSIIELVQNVIKNKLEMIGSQFVTICVEYDEHFQICEAGTEESLIIIDVIAYTLRKFPVKEDDFEFINFKLIPKTIPKAGKMIFFDLIKDLLDRSLRFGEVDNVHNDMISQFQENTALSNIVQRIEHNQDIFLKFKKSFLMCLSQNDDDLCEMINWVHEHTTNPFDKKTVYSLLYFEYTHLDLYFQIASHYTLFIEDNFSDFIIQCRNPTELIEKFYQKSIDMIRDQLLEGDSKWNTKFLKLKSVITPATYKHRYISKEHSETYQALLVASVFQICTGKVPKKYTIAPLTEEIDDPVLKTRFLTMTLIECHHLVPFNLKVTWRSFLERCVGLLESDLWKLVPISVFYGAFQRLLDARIDISFSRDDMIESLREVVNSISFYDPGRNKLHDIVFEWIKTEHQEVAQNIGNYLNWMKTTVPRDVYDMIYHAAIKERSLLHLRDLLLDDLTIMKQIDNELITHLFKDQYMTLDFLSCIQSDTSLVELLHIKDEEIIKMFGLQPFLIDSIQSQNLHMMPYMYTDEYKNLESKFTSTADDLFNYISEQFSDSVSIPSQKNKIKMNLFLILYHSFFAKDLKCEILSNLMDRLPDLLDLDKQEILAYKFYMNGLYSATKKDPLLWYFSKSVYESKKPLEMYWSQFLVNITAICFGTPKSKNYLWTRAFNAAELYESLGPGSTFRNGNADCGYKFNHGSNVSFSEKSTYEFVRPDILNGNQFHHAAMNTLTWGAGILWMLYNPTKEKDLVNIVNHIDEDCASFERINDCQLSAGEKVSYALFMKCSAFNTITREMCLNEHATEPLLFFTHVLFLYAQSLPESDLVSIMRQESHCRKYEDFIHKVGFVAFFEKKKEIMDSLHRYDVIKKIETHRESIKLSKRQVTPRDTFFVESMSKFMNSNPLDPKTVVFNLYTSILTDPKQRYSKLQELSYIVTFYCKLLKLTQSKYTKEQTLALTVHQVIEDLKGKILYQDFEEFVKKWGKLSMEADLCDPTDRLMVHIDQNTVFARLMNIKNEDSGIFKWIQTMASYFGQISSFTCEENIPMNFKINIKHLSLPMVPSLVISNIDHVPAMLKCCTLDEFGLDFDWNIVSHLILQYVIGNKAILDTTPLENEYYVYKMDHNNENLEDIQKISQESILFKLSRWDRTINPKLHNFFVSAPDEQFKWIHGLKSKDVILDLLKYLWHIVPYLDYKAPDHFCGQIVARISLSSLAWVKDAIHKDHLARIHSLPTKHLKSLMETLVHLHHNLDSQTSEYPSHNKQFTKNIMIHLESAKTKLMTGNIQQNYQYCCNISQYLLSETFQSFLQNSSQAQYSLLSIGSIKYEFEKFGFWPCENFLHPEIIIEMYGTYLKWLQVTLGRLNLLLLTEPKGSNITTYCEKVGKRFFSTQIDLVNQEAIEETPSVRGSPQLESFGHRHDKTVNLSDDIHEDLNFEVETRKNSSKGIKGSLLNKKPSQDKQDGDVEQEKFGLNQLRDSLKLYFVEPSYCSQAVKIMRKMNDSMKIQHLNHFNKLMLIANPNSSPSANDIFEIIYNPASFAKRHGINWEIEMPLVNRIDLFMKSIKHEPQDDFEESENEESEMKSYFEKLFGGSKELEKAMEMSQSKSHQEKMKYFNAFKKIQSDLQESYNERSDTCSSFAFERLCFALVYDLNDFCEMMGVKCDLDYIHGKKLEDRMISFSNIMINYFIGDITGKEAIMDEWPDIVLLDE